MYTFDANGVAYQSKHPRHPHDPHPSDDPIDVFEWGSKQRHPHAACHGCKLWDVVQEKMPERDPRDVKPRYLPIVSIAQAQRPPGSMSRMRCDGCYASYFDPEPDFVSEAEKAKALADWREAKDALDKHEAEERRRKAAVRRWRQWVSDWREFVDLQAGKGVYVDPDPELPSATPAIARKERTFDRRERAAFNVRTIRHETAVRWARKECLAVGVDPTTAMASGALVGPVETITADPRASIRFAPVDAS